MLFSRAAEEKASRKAKESFDRQIAFLAHMEKEEEARFRSTWAKERLDDATSRWDNESKRFDEHLETITQKLPGELTLTLTLSLTLLTITLTRTYVGSHA